MMSERLGSNCCMNRLKLYSQPNEVCVVMRVERCSVDQARLMQCVVNVYDMRIIRLPDIICLTRLQLSIATCSTSA